MGENGEEVIEKYENTPRVLSGNIVILLGEGRIVGGHWENGHLCPPPPDKTLHTNITKLGSLL